MVLLRKKLPDIVDPERPCDSCKMIGFLYPSDEPWFEGLLYVKNCEYTCVWRRFRDSILACMLHVIYMCVCVCGFLYPYDEPWLEGLLYVKNCEYTRVWRRFRDSILACMLHIIYIYIYIYIYVYMCVYTHMICRHVGGKHTWICAWTARECVYTYDMQVRGKLMHVDMCMNSTCVCVHVQELLHSNVNSHALIYT